MPYTTDSRLFQQQLEAALLRARSQPIWAGVGAYRLDPAGLVEKVVLARQAGAGGVVVFSHESLDSVHLRQLRERAFAPRVGLQSPGGRSTGAR
jgi:hypothetical protein